LVLQPNPSVGSRLVKVSLSQLRSSKGKVFNVRAPTGHK